VRARGVGPIMLRPVGTQLVAEMRGNLVGLLGISDDALYTNDGAGRGISSLATWPPFPFVAA
jgi:hypothetical protein